MPRDTFTAPLTLPVCCTSFGSRTSTTSTPPERTFFTASAGESFGTAAVASANISLTVFVIRALPSIVQLQKKILGGAWHAKARATGAPLSRTPETERSGVEGDRDPAQERAKRRFS